MSPPQPEPVRRNVYPAAVVAALVAALGPLATAPDLDRSVTLGALAVALTVFGSVAFGLERGRSIAYSPATHDQVVRTAVLRASAVPGDPAPSPLVEHHCPTHGASCWTHPDLAHCPVCAGETPESGDPELQERPT
jgi:hypothetical protein